jgi:PTH1 family peptidyl-tRNA hydrolase
MFNRKRKNKMIVGLGNPGDKFENTRHNSGFLFLNFLIKQFPKESLFVISKFSKSQVYFLSAQNLYFLKPQTYMNLSGIAVREVSDYFKIDTKNIYIAYDDLDIKLGKYKIDIGKHPKDHNGVSSVLSHLNKKDFYNIRIGIDSRDNSAESKQISGEDYVLQKFSKQELETVHNVFPDIQKAMNLDQFAA